MLAPAAAAHSSPVSEEEEHLSDDGSIDALERVGSAALARRAVPEPVPASNASDPGISRHATPATEPPPPPKPKPVPLVVESISIGGRPTLLETVWTAEIESQSEDFAVDVALSNGLTVVVPHFRGDPNDDNWFVIAKDSTQKRRLLARFQTHVSQPTLFYMATTLIGSPFSKDLSTLFVLVLATVLAILNTRTSKIGVDLPPHPKQLVGVSLTSQELGSLYRSLLLLALCAAFVVSILGKFRLSFIAGPKRYNLVIKRWTEEDDSLLESRQRITPGLLGHHTMVHDITKSFQACIARSESDPNAAELKVGALLEAIEKSLRIGEVFGPMMVLAVKNDEGNLAKVQKSWSKMREVDRKRASTLRGLLEAEKAAGIHKPGGHLADPSAAIALLWMRRTLMFQNAVFQGACDNNSGSLGSVARAAYASQLEQFHGWLLKNTFLMALNGMPSREEFMQRLAPNVKQKMEREQLCVKEMRECTTVVQQVITIMCNLFDELDLEDSRKV